MNQLVRVAVAILKREALFLVAERPLDKPYGGYWEFPGGKIEDDELPETALKRELHEELGIEVTAAQVWFEQEHDYPDKRVLLHVWLVTAFKGEPYGREEQALRWVGLDEMVKLRVLEGNWLIIEKMKSLIIDEK